MTIVMKVNEAETQIAELLTKVEAGEEVVITRGDVPIARISPVPAKEDVSAVIARIRAQRVGQAPTTIEEILEWRDEGRRF